MRNIDKQSVSLILLDFVIRHAFDQVKSIFRGRRTSRVNSCGSIYSLHTSGVFMGGSVTLNRYKWSRPY